jgi:hypothetical protein
MNKANLKRLIGTVTAAVALAPYAALAQFGGAMNKLNSVAGENGAGYTTSDDSGTLLLTQIGDLIKIAIALTGVIFLGYTIFAGYTWMTAQGDTKKVKEAQDTMKSTIIGIVIVALAYGITAFVFNKLGAPEATSNQ